MPHRINPLLLFPVLLAACAPADDVARYTVTDSAGIRIVESVAPHWQKDGWTLDAEPALDLGVREGDDTYLFDEIIDLRLLDDGGVVVANMGDNSVRTFDADGTLLWRAGRSGEGPGEYRQLWRVRSPAPGRILATQSTQYWPDYLYDADGELIQQIDKPGLPTGVPIFATGVFNDGGYLYSSWPQGYPGRGDRWLDSATVYLPNADGTSIDSILSMPAAIFTRFDDRRGDMLVFGPNLIVAAGNDYFYATFNEVWDIGVYDRTGRLVSRIRRTFTPREVTQKEIDLYREDFLGMRGEDGRVMPQSERARRERLLVPRQYATHHPVHGRILIDRLDNVWVEHDVFRTGGSAGFNAVYDDPTQWDIFDARGVWLGGIETPPRFRVMDVNADFVAGIWRDAVDVEHVRVYRLRKE